MNTTTIVIVTMLGLMAVLLIGALAYWWYKRNKPMHSFIGVDFGANSVQPKRIKNLFGPFKFKRNDKSVVTFPVPQGYAVPRQDGRGTVFFGDLSTGQLFLPKRDGESVKLDFAHGIFNELALSDGRVAQIVQHTKGGAGIKMEHLLIGLVVIFGLLVFNVYQFATGH